MKKNKYSALLKNMGILTIGNFGSKILSYFLVPIYTLYLTTSEYGLFDLIQSSINLLIPILTINMSAVILRFSLDENADFKSIFSIAIKISLIGILFISIIFNLKEGFKPTLIYVIGWSIFCILLFIFDFKNFYNQSGYFDLVLVVFAIEAMLFTISIAYKYNDLKVQNKNFEKLILQQSKFAKSGEMIANITHQFRQPLNNISYILMNLKKRFENKNLDEIYFDKKVFQANEQLNFLSKTIDDFKEFYMTSKEKEIFSVKDAILNATTILSADLKTYNIELNTSFETFEEVKIFGVKSELSQVLIAIISNSIDVLKSKKNPKIKIEVFSSSAEVIIKLADNGGGIKPKNLKKIFEPYFSTKEEGTGIGLYLSKMIIEESFAGKILVENKKEGVLFSLFIEKAL
mgnify:CR=1 FL=1